jgi:hypothetical protein
MHNARKHWRRGLAALALGCCCAATAVAQVTLRLATPAVVTAGSGFTAELSVEGLGPAGDGLALGAYDLDLVLDTDLLSFTAVSFGGGGHSGLDAGISGSFAAFDDSVPGRITLREISFEAASDLTAAQPGSFVLLSVHLTALGPGTWTPRLEAVVLADHDGLALTPNVAAMDVVIRAVPEPAAASLWLLGLVATGVIARRTASFRR